MLAPLHRSWSSWNCNQGLAALAHPHSTGLCCADAGRLSAPLMHTPCEGAAACLQQDAAQPPHCDAHSAPCRTLLQTREPRLAAACQAHHQTRPHIGARSTRADGALAAPHLRVRSSRTTISTVHSNAVHWQCIQHMHPGRYQLGQPSPTWADHKSTGPHTTWARCMRAPHTGHSLARKAARQQHLN
jgi:hypothetical protein